MAKKSKAEQLKEKELAKKKAALERQNKKHKTNFVNFDDGSLGTIEFIHSGDLDLDFVLSDIDDGSGGWPRGRFIELFGPEGSGKTFLVSKLFATCAERELKVALYDAEGTYHKDFAALHGVDIDKLDISYEDEAEKIFEEIESLCNSNIYDVIAIDSLASLVPRQVADNEMGKQSYSPLAGTISRCIPRLNSAVKKSKTVLILINQLRDDVGKFAGYGPPPEKTPGGRAIKFAASLRVDVRKRSYGKTDRPDLYDVHGRAIGHSLKIKTIKNKICSPGRVTELDLMYEKPREILKAIKEAIDTDVIARQRTKAGDLRGKKLTYREMEYSPPVKEDPTAVLLWLKENDLICHLLEDMGHDDFDQFIESEDLTPEEIQNYMGNSEIDSVGKDTQKA